MGGGGGGQASRRWTLREHTAAVKALAWCPTRPHLLATGGGTSDRHIRLYDTSGVGGGEGGEGGGPRLLQAVDSRSQVCSLRWHAERPHLLSTHGYSDHALMVWETSRGGGGGMQLSKLCEMSGHTARVLHSALSPDGTEVCSAGADETLRFWKVWDALPTKRSTSKHHQRMQSLQLTASIR